MQTCFILFGKGAVHKIHPGGVFVQYGHFSDTGGPQMRTSALFSAKNFAFFKIYGVSTRTRVERVEPVRTFFGQGWRGQFFAILCGRLLWTAPNS